MSGTPEPTQQCRESQDPQTCFPREASGALPFAFDSGQLPFIQVSGPSLSHAGRRTISSSPSAMAARPTTTAIRVQSSVFVVTNFLQSTSSCRRHSLKSDITPPRLDIRVFTRCCRVENLQGSNRRCIPSSWRYRPCRLAGCLNQLSRGFDRLPINEDASNREGLVSAGCALEY